MRLRIGRLPNFACRDFAVGLLALLTLPLAGCTVPASPTVPLFGAYFPFWLICAAVGVIGAVAIRMLLIRVGIDEMLTWRLLVYTCLAAAIGFGLALVVFGR